MFEINRKLLMDRSVPDRIGTTLLSYDVPIQPLPKEELSLLHFTKGGPYFSDYKNCSYSPK